MSVYLVTGPKPYRNHEPGETFEAVLTTHAERRAVNHGAVILVERSTPQLKPGSWTLPEDRRC